MKLIKTMKYKAPNGSIHKSKLEYLEGLVIDLEATIKGKDVVIQDCLEHIHKVTGKSYYSFLEED